MPFCARGRGHSVNTRSLRPPWHLAGDSSAHALGRHSEALLGSRFSRSHSTQRMRAQVLKLHPGALQVRRHGAARQGVLCRCNESLLVLGLLEQVVHSLFCKCLWVFLVAGLVHDRVHPKPEICIACLLNQALFEFTGQAILVNELIHDAHIATVIS